MIVDIVRDDSRLLLRMHRALVIGAGSKNWCWHFSFCFFAFVLFASYACALLMFLATERPCFSIYLLSITPAFLLSCCSYRPGWFHRTWNTSYRYTVGIYFRCCAAVARLSISHHYVFAGHLEIARQIVYYLVTWSKDTTMLPYTACHCFFSSGRLWPAWTLSLRLRFVCLVVVLCCFVSVFRFCSGFISLCRDIFIPLVRWALVMRLTELWFAF